MAADPYLVASITASATVVAATMGGFGAAALKHHWDVDDTELRWERERTERRRDELKVALSQFFSTRGDVTDSFVIAQAEPDNGRRAIRRYEGGLAALAVLLDIKSELAETFLTEAEKFSTWMNSQIHDS
jgi:hypothetical protein